MSRESALLRPGKVTILRQASSILVADNSSLVDANIPVAQAVDCGGYDTVFIGCEITLGTSPTMTVEALFHDPEAADGSKWKRLLLGAKDGVTLAALAAETTGALDGASFVELRDFGHAKVFFRITAVANPTSTTAWKILGIPGKVRARGRVR